MRNRILTSLLLFGIAGFVLHYGKLPMFLWVLFVGIACAYELIQMGKKNGVSAKPIVVYTMVTAAITSAYLPMTTGLWTHPMVMASAFLCLMLCILELVKKRVLFSQTTWAYTFRIVLFVSLTCPYIYLVRDTHQGFSHVLFALLVIWSTDILALLGGKLFGKTPLTPISPKKTVEGSLIGLLSSVIFSSLYIFLSIRHSGMYANLPVYIALAAILSIMAQAGDLHESLVKRHMKVKDSSNLLPGHGGVYDRADSTLFVMPLFFYLLQF